MTTTNAHLLQWLALFVGLWWLATVSWVSYMLGRMLRWKYLEMKHAPTWTTPPPARTW